MKRAFTIIELVIVIAILLILAGAALGGVGGIIRGLRFSNAFNKMVLMVQQARSLAVTGKNSDMKWYEVEFSSATAIFKGEKEDASTQEIERFAIDAGSNLSFTNKSSCTLATIRFLNRDAQTQLICTGASAPQVTLLTIGLQETDPTAPAGAAAVVRSKSFTIHRAAGIPQIN